jgi:MFS superfamily sulfate permease-like transporter
MEFHWALIAAFGVMALGTLNGLLVAVLVSMVSLIVRANRHPIHVLGRKPGTNAFRPLSSEHHPEDETYPGVLLLRPEGVIFFANAPRLVQEMRALIANFAPRVLVLDLSAVPDMEYTALMMLTDGEAQVREAGTLVALVAMNPFVLEVIRRSPLWERLGDERMFFTLDQAVEWFQRQSAGDSTQKSCQDRKEMVTVHVSSFIPASIEIGGI